MGDKAIDALHRFARGKPTTLYHFTRQKHIESVLRQGINRGEVCLAMDQSKNAPWLTVEGRFFEQTWAIFVTNRGVSDYQNPMEHPKTEVRFTVTIPVSHIGKLHHWPTWAREQGVNRNWLESLFHADGGLDKANRHWFYDGVVLPEWISATDLREPCPSPQGRLGLIKRMQEKALVPVVRTGCVIGQDISLSQDARDRIALLESDPAAYIRHLLSRQQRADYGDLDPTEHLLNATVLKRGEGRVFSRYPTPHGPIIVATLFQPGDTKGRTILFIPEEDE